MNPPLETPLTETTYFILLSLSSKPRHGYAIMQDVQDLSEGRIILSTGTLYGALKRLLELGWIVRLDDSGAKGNSRDRKVYKVTESGQHILKEEIARLQKLLMVAEQHALREHT